MRAFVKKHHARRVDDVRLNTGDVDCFRDVLDPDDVVVRRATYLRGLGKSKAFRSASLSIEKKCLLRPNGPERAREKISRLCRRKGRFWLTQSDDTHKARPVSRRDFCQFESEK